ncbi:MAG: hypothetical protein IT167_05405 [Bryobacterales bacterium]|nr:hypothetical protein [Bryobacterales bacterium]
MSYTELHSMDVEKTIEFLLQSQADLTEKQRQTEINISRLIEAQYNTEQNVAALSGALMETDRRLDSVSTRLDSVSARLDQLAERQLVTESSLQTQTENLNALIKVVDDIVRGRQ